MDFCNMYLYSITCVCTSVSVFNYTSSIHGKFGQIMKSFYSQYYRGNYVNDVPEYRKSNIRWIRSYQENVCPYLGNTVEYIFRNYAPGSLPLAGYR